MVHITGYCRHSNSLKQHFRLCDCETLKPWVIVCGIGSVYRLVTLLMVRNSGPRFTKCQCFIVWTALSVKMTKVVNLIGRDCHAHLNHNVLPCIFFLILPCSQVCYRCAWWLRTRCVVHLCKHWNTPKTCRCVWVHAHMRGTQGCTHLFAYYSNIINSYLFSYSKNKNEHTTYVGRVKCSPSAWHTEYRILHVPISFHVYHMM